MHPKCTVHHLEKVGVTLSSLHLSGEELKTAEVGASCELNTLLATLQKHHARMTIRINAPNSFILRTHAKTQRQKNAQGKTNLLGALCDLLSVSHF
jgi:hypothetical protein